MKGIPRVLGLGAGIVVLGAVATVGIAQSSNSTGPFTADIANNLVNKCAGIRNGEMVWINGGTQDQRLLEDLAIEVRKLGAHPVITIGSERLSRNLVTDVPARWDSQEPVFALKMADTVNAFFTIDTGQDPGLFADIPAERLAIRSKAWEPFEKKLLDNGVLQIHLGNGLYPTVATARQFGISERQLESIFWSGVNVDYDRLRTRAERVRTALNSGKEVRITAPNGTDLTFRINGREMFASNGTISAEQRYAGGPECQVWLPAGEVYGTAVPDTANGTFVASNFFYGGQWIEDLELTFKNGTLQDMTAKGDLTRVRETFDAAPKGREIFAGFDIGVNPNVKVPADSRMVTWMASGTVSVGLGGNTWAGGENDVPYGLWAHLTDATFTVDGKKLVDRGNLQPSR